MVSRSGGPVLRGGVYGPCGLFEARVKLTTAGPPTLELEAEDGGGDGLLGLQGRPLGTALGETVVILAIIWQGLELQVGILTWSEFQQVSSLPSKEELLAELLGVPLEGGGDPAGVLAVAALQHRVAAMVGSGRTPCQ